MAAGAQGIGGTLRGAGDVVLTRVRVWLPDAPGVLGTLATAIGAAEGNVVGLEVLEREAGVAIDELVVELPDRAGAVEAMCHGIRDVPGAGVEEVFELGGEESHDRVGTVLAAAAAIVASPAPATVLRTLCAKLSELFGLSWLALVDERLERYVAVRGVQVPPVSWVAAFAEGASSGADPAKDTSGSGVFVEAMPGAGLVVCGERPAAIRQRERREIAMLAMVAARYFDALDGRSGIGRANRVPRSRTRPEVMLRGA